MFARKTRSYDIDLILERRQDHRAEEGRENLAGTKIDSHRSMDQSD